MSWSACSGYVPIHKLPHLAHAQYKQYICRHDGLLSQFFDSRCCSPMMAQVVYMLVHYSVCGRQAHCPTELGSDPFNQCASGFSSCFGPQSVHAQRTVCCMWLQLLPGLDWGACLELDATCFGLLVRAVAGFKAHILAQYNQQDEVDQRQQQETCSTCRYMTRA